MRKRSIVNQVVDDQERDDQNKVAAAKGMEVAEVAAPEKDTAAAAGVVTFAAANDGVFNQQNDGDDILNTERKTPKQYRTQPMKRKLDTAKTRPSEMEI